MFVLLSLNLSACFGPLACASVAVLDVSKTGAGKVQLCLLLAVSAMEQVKEGGGGARDAYRLDEVNGYHHVGQQGLKDGIAILFSLCFCVFVLFVFLFVYLTFVCLCFRLLCFRLFVFVCAYSIVRCFLNG